MQKGKKTDIHTPALTKEHMQSPNCGTTNIPCWGYRGSPNFIHRRATKRTTT
jgi:hypothetical protein